MNMNTAQPQTQATRPPESPASEEAITLTSFDMRAAEDAIYGGKTLPPEPPAPPAGGGLGAPKDSPAPGSQEGGAGAGDDAVALPAWDDEVEAPKEEEGADEPPTDLPPDPSDDRETWRRERLNKKQAQVDYWKARAENLEAQAKATPPAPPTPTMQQPIPGAFQPQGQPAFPQAQNPLQDRDRFVAYLVQTDVEVNSLARARLAVDQKLQAGGYADQASYIADLTATNTALEVAIQNRATQVTQAAQTQAANQQAQQTQQLQVLRSNLDARVKSSPIPHMGKLLERIDRNAQQLHPQLQMAILEHPRPEIVVAALGSDQAEFKWFADQSARAQRGAISPAALARLGEVVARYEAQASPAARQTQQKAKEQTLPQTPRSRNGGEANYADMSPEEYAEALSKGRVKDVLGL